MPMGIPEWPDLAAATASSVNARMAAARIQWSGCSRRRVSMSTVAAPRLRWLVRRYQPAADLQGRVRQRTRTAAARVGFAWSRRLTKLPRFDDLHGAEGGRMTEIEELERRVEVALERIRAGVERARADAAERAFSPEIQARAEAADEFEARVRELESALPELEARASTAEARAEELESGRAALEDALEAERGAGAQLAERMRQIKRLHEAGARRMQAQADELAARLEAAEDALARQRAANDRLLEASEALRTAAEAGEAPPVDEALRAELDALRAAREADRDEVDAILGELAPLVEREEEGA